MVTGRNLTLLLALMAGCGPSVPEAPSPLTPDAPVSIEGGSVTGVLAETAEDVIAFKGVPYAAPPVGELRWSSPAPVRPWNGVAVADEYGPNCMQARGEGPGMDEDCLYLNLWTLREKTEPHPVMVWIHGGGFTSGSGSGLSFVGTHLAARGVVLVTINYRLNVFGFMAHPALSAESGYGGSGNYGLLDVVAALEWVRDNIGEFGGDPNRVTIFGESAGGGMVMSTMLVPQAEGLFHRAIGQSNWVYGWDRGLSEAVRGMPSAEAGGVRVAELLEVSDPHGSLAELRAADAQRVLTAYREVESSPFTREGFPWGPNVDRHVIPDDPVMMYQSGRQHDVPLVVGMNGNEGSLFSRRLGIDEVGEFEALVRHAYPAHADRALKHFAVQTDDDVRAGRDHYIHDLYFAGPVRLHARSHANVSSDAWLYHFAHVPPTARGRIMGSHHTAEIRYVFGNLTGPGTYTLPVAAEGEVPSGVDLELSETIMDYWVQFAKTGDPNVEGRPDWPAYDLASDNYLELAKEITTGLGVHRAGGELFDAVEATRRAVTVN